MTDALAASVEHVQSAILLADDEQAFIYANSAASELLGYSNEELLGMTVWDITPVGNREDGKRLWEAFVRQGRQRGDYEIRRKDGEVRVFRYSAVANVVPGVHLSDLHDITDLKRAEAILRTRVDEKQLLIRELQHRVRTLLATAVSVIQLYMVESSRLSVTDMARRIISRLKSLSAMARLTGDPDQAADEIAVDALLSDVVQSAVDAVAVDPGLVQWSVEPTPAQLSWETAHPLALVLNEVISNHLRHSVEPDAELEVRVTCEAEAGVARSICVHVSRPFATPPDRWQPRLGLALLSELTAQLGAQLDYLPADSSATVRLQLS